jgi:hypothetical protein
MATATSLFSWNKRVSFCDDSQSESEPNFRIRYILLYVVRSKEDYSELLKCHELVKVYVQHLSIKVRVLERVLYTRKFGKRSFVCIRMKDLIRER